jgi:hypothetical protein
MAQTAVPIQQFVPFSPAGLRILTVSVLYFGFFLSSTPCLSFLRVSVPVLLPFFITPASLLSLALLSNHSLALSFALYPASDYHIRYVKLLSFLRLLLSFPYYLVLYPCISFLSFYPFPLVSVSVSYIVCQYLMIVYRLYMQNLPCQSPLSSSPLSLMPSVSSGVTGRAKWKSDVSHIVKVENLMWFMAILWSAVTVLAFAWKSLKLS